MISQEPNNNQQEAPVKKSKGRQKIKIEKIENQTNLQVTFSKRKSGLFKKASELCTLCGAEGCVIVFSPANKAYCFGHPSLEAIIERYEREQQQQENNNDDVVANDDNAADDVADDVDADPIEQRRDAIMGAQRTSNIRELSSQLTRLQTMNRNEKGLEEEIECMRKIGVAQKWFPKPVQEMSYAELCVTRDSVLQFKTNLNERVQMIIKENTTIVAATNIPANPNFNNNGGSNNNNNGTVHINSVVNYNNTPVSDPYRPPAVPGIVDQNITRGVSLFDQFGLTINNSPYVPQQITPTYADAPQVPQGLPSDNINLLPPFVHTGDSSDLGLGNYYGGTFEIGEGSNSQQAAVSGHLHQATTDYAPLVGSGDATAGLYYNNTSGLGGYDQQMTGAGFAGNVNPNYNPNVGSAAGNINLGGYGDQQHGGPITNLQGVPSDNQQFGLNDQLAFDPNSVGTTHQLPFDPNSVGTTQQPPFDPNSFRTTQQLPFDPNSVGTTQQPPFDPNSFGTTQQLSFDPNSVGTTQQPPFDPNGVGTTQQPPFDPNSVGTTQQLPFDPNTNDFGYGGFDGTGGFGAGHNGMQ